MRKLLIPLLLLVLLLTACSNDDNPETASTPPPTAETQPYQVALVMKTLTNPFFIEMERGAREAETDLGITLIVRTAAQETSIEQQIEIIDDLITENVDAIVISPGDSQALIPVLKKAQDAGIVIINIDNRLDPEFAASTGLVNVPYISVDNEQGGYLSAQAISMAVTEPAEAIILEGIQTAQNGQDRKAGAERAFAENEHITVVASETANWKIDEAYSVTGQLLEQHPGVKLIFAANDMMALGAIQYLQENELTDVQVAAYDALTDAVAAIKEGKLVATIDQQAARQGYLGVEYAVQTLGGEDVPMETMVDVLLVTAENAE